MAANRGNGVWRSSVKEAQWGPVNFNMSGAMGTPEDKFVGSPMQQQPALAQTYPPQGATQV